ncbi:MAG: leishmanolysin-related zinc metalloendopeptidase, partial [Mycoplasma sp.]
SDKKAHPIKFHIAYESINLNNLVDDTYIIFVKEVLDLAIKTFADLLNVSNDMKVSLNDRGVCYTDNLIFSEEVTNGVDADIIIYPIIKELNNGVIASARFCHLSSVDWRPISGVVYLQPNYDMERQNAKEYLHYVFLHEITHIWVFSKTLFGYFKRQPVSKSVTVNGVKTNIIITPRVVQVAKQYFNCDNLEGVETERASDGRVSSHWESRIMLGEWLCSTFYPELAFSEITLALYEDSGWYEVNYYTGGLFRFGKNEGCNFWNEKCIIDESTNFPNEFCWTSFGNKCFSGHSTRGTCYLRTELEIPPEYQYFTDKTKGGLSSVDYCPVPLHPVDEDNYFAGNCKNGKTNNFNDEVIGDNSICIDNILSLDEIEWFTKPTENQATCYPINCNFENRSLTISIGDSDVLCSEKQESAIVDGYNGKIICPEFSRVCTGKHWCNDLMSCVSKKSEPIWFNRPIVEDDKEEDDNKRSNYIHYNWVSILLFLI